MRSLLQSQRTLSVGGSGKLPDITNLAKNALRDPSLTQAHQYHAAGDVVTVQKAKLSGDNVDIFNCLKSKT